MRQIETFATRLKWLRKKHRLTLQGFGQVVRASPTYLSKLERGLRVSPSQILIHQICERFSVNESWLIGGKGEPFVLPSLNEIARSQAPIVTIKVTSPNAPEETVAVTPTLLKSMLGARSPKDLLDDLIALLKKSPYGPATTLETAKLLAFGLEAVTEAKEPGQSFVLTETSSDTKTSGVKPLLPGLLARLRNASVQPGKKTELAKYLDAPLASVSRWLSEEREPGGEIALRMLEWVKDQERKTKQ